MYFRIVQNHRNFIVNKEVNVVGIRYIGLYYDITQLLILNIVWRV